MAYRGILECGWPTGVHDCRAFRYQHPWLVVHRDSGTVQGCYSRAEARRVLAELEAGVGIEEPARAND